jgi:hypothetical protein
MPRILSTSKLLTRQQLSGINGFPLDAERCAAHSQWTWCLAALVQKCRGEEIELARLELGSIHAQVNLQCGAGLGFAK